MTLELRAELYAAFASDYDELDREGMTRMLAGLDVCSALEEMGWADLGKLEDKGSLYSLTVFKYVLPRWLELLDEEEVPNWWIDDESFKNKLRIAQWREWPLVQVESVRAVFRSWGTARMRTGRMDAFVDFLGQLEDDFAPYLTPWLRTRPLEVAQWVEAQNWRRVDPAIVLWAVEPRVEERLEAAFWANPDGEYAEVFSHAAQLLRSVRALNSES